MATTQAQLSKRMDVERRMVRKLIRVAKEHGFALVNVYDGEENVRCTSEAQAMDAVFAVDDSTIRFKHPDQPKNHCAVIVLGNDGWDCIADASMGEKWDDVMEVMWAYGEKLSEEA
jgi:DNA-binding transcriptional regulator LsrR (DeoR family)